MWSTFVTPGRCCSVVVDLFEEKGLFLGSAQRNATHFFREYSLFALIPFCALRRKVLGEEAFEIFFRDRPDAQRKAAGGEREHRPDAQRKAAGCDREPRAPNTRTKEEKWSGQIMLSTRLREDLV